MNDTIKEYERRIKNFYHKIHNSDNENDVIVWKKQIENLQIAIDNERYNNYLTGGINAN